MISKFVNSSQRARLRSTTFMNYSQNLSRALLRPQAFVPLPTSLYFIFSFFSFSFKKKEKRKYIL